MNKNKKKILSGLLALWLLGNLSYDHKTTLNYEIINKKGYFANYSNGKVYIGNKWYIEHLSNVDDSDVLIVDEHKLKDPIIKILSSYKIINYSERNEILAIIDEYEKMYPSKWDRSIASMKVEWFIHNLLYYLNYETIRTKDVDFNNKDEEVYQKKLIKNFIR